MKKRAVYTISSDGQRSTPKKGKYSFTGLTKRILSITKKGGAIDDGRSGGQVDYDKSFSPHSKVSPQS